MIIFSASNAIKLSLIINVHVLYLPGDSVIAAIIDEEILRHVDDYFPANYLIAMHVGHPLKHWLTKLTFPINPICDLIYQK